MYTKLFLGVFTGLILISAPMIVVADSFTDVPSLNSTTRPPGAFELQNPLQAKSICSFVKAVFNGAMVVGIPVATFFIIYAGFLFVTARGRPEQLTTAKTNLMYVALGVAVFLGAWFLAQIIAATIQALAPGLVIGSC